MKQANNELTITPVEQIPWYAIPAILLVIAATAFLLTNIRVVLTDSIDATLVWETADKPAMGDFVSFELTNPVIPTPDHTIAVTKKLSCTAGQQLIRQGDEWFCDDTLLGSNRTYALNGDLLEQFFFDGQIPEGKGFVLGDNKNSFDSRYWGFVDLDRVVVVKKVF